ncbi:hypothetical protein [Rhodopila sp.]|uniref:hypothetical protein n=1 Tax=Rhodopila sp. TaxID=2480087 RepID=UPI003D0AAFFC
MTMDPQMTAAATLFPDLPINTDAARAIPAAKPAPAAPAPVAQPAPVAKVDEQTLDAKADAMDRAFGLGKYAPGPDGKTAADREAEAAAGAKAAEASPADWIDHSHPDAAAVAPVIADLKLNQDQTAKLETLHQQMNAAAIDRQSAAWAAEAQTMFAKDRTMLADAQSAIRTYGSAELKAVLNSTGLGNNATVIRAFANAWRSNPMNYGTRRY